MTRLTDSGSRRSCSDVEPIRSANTMVTILRTSALSAAGALRLGASTGLRTGSVRVASDAPQAMQNRASPSFSVPHARQRGASGVPQPAQNRAIGGFVLPQLAQLMTAL